VCAARFSGSSDSPGACGERIDAIVRWRREHQPGGANAGSVFSNPPGDSAGRLIEATGLKGLRVGGAVVSEKHANFVVADKSATASDVCGLIDEVRRRVADATGTVLETEVRLVGFAVTRPIDTRGRR
jgi:UDP-N-acetylmuramate dehydrogenase